MVKYYSWKVKRNSSAVQRLNSPTFMFDGFIEKLESSLCEDLPGLESHRKMTFRERRIDFQTPDHAVMAGVMILLYPNAKGEPQLIYIKRKSTEGDVHKGQISFPGGKLENDDLSIKHAAVRETYEEIGVLVPEQNVIGSLTKLYIPVSNFEVHPFVSYLGKKPSFIMEIKELDDIIEIPLKHFENPAVLSKKNILISRNIVLEDVPYFNLYGHTLWGATAMMTAEFLDLVDRISFGAGQ